jgi:hypothetical protein
MFSFAMKAYDEEKAQFQTSSLFGVDEGQSSASRSGHFKLGEITPWAPE